MSEECNNTEQYMQVIVACKKKDSLMTTVKQMDVSYQKKVKTRKEYTQELVEVDFVVFPASCPGFLSRSNNELPILH